MSRSAARARAGRDRTSLYQEITGITTATSPACFAPMRPSLDRRGGFTLYYARGARRTGYDSARRSLLQSLNVRPVLDVGG
jgi:hypothetical protein